MANNAALNDAGDLLALSLEGEVSVVELPGGRAVGRIGGNGYATVSFAGDHLLVQRQAGPLEVWNERGSEWQRNIAGEAGYTPASDAAGSLVARSLPNGTIALYDLDSGDRLARFGTPGQSFFFRTGVALTPSGDELVAASEIPEGTQRGEVVWRDISRAGLVEAACEAAGHELTTAEWQTQVGGVSPPADLSCG